MAVPLRITRIIWGALLVATLIYSAIAVTLGQRNAPLMQAHLHDPFVQIIYGIAAITFGVAFFMRSWMRDRGRPAQLYNIVSWALFESIAIYGLVPAMLHADWRLMAAPEMLAFAGFVLTFPQETTI